MVGKRYYSDCLIELNSNEGEGVSMQNELFTSKAGGLSLYRCQWWVQLSQQLNSMLKSIYKATSQPDLFLFIPRSRASSSSVAASLLTLTFGINYPIWLPLSPGRHPHPEAGLFRPLFH